MHSASTIQNKPCLLPNTKCKNTVDYFKERIIKHCWRTTKYTPTTSFLLILPYLLQA